MTSKATFRKFDATRSKWLYSLLILLIIEKIIQHIVVTLAFYFNWANIASTVVISPSFLMVSGAIIAGLFLINFWGMIRKQTWSITLTIFLALFDIIGEFVAQGKIGIVITVSFMVAALLLILVLIYRRQLHPV